MKVAELLEYGGSKEIERLASKLNVEFELQRDEPEWWLWQIERGDASKSGSGAKVLKALCKEADKAKKKIILEPANTKLVSYYEQFGFKSISKSRMVREPK